MTAENFRVKGIVLTAPLIRDVDVVCEWIDTYLAGHVNLIVMQTRYRYQFRSHPECIGAEPLSEQNVKMLVSVCRKNGIRLLPKMNLLGHQSGVHNIPSDGILHGVPGNNPTELDGLLRAYPDFEEKADDPSQIRYSRQLCPSNPRVKPVVFDLIDELLEAFEADGIHIGCDEALNIGLCPDCRRRGNAAVFADWITSLDEHVRSKNAEMLMWGDRFLNADQTGYGEYEASGNMTDPAIDMVPNDIVICDWHYEDMSRRDNVYPSVDIFGKKGFPMLLAPLTGLDRIDAFLGYARAHDAGNIRGVLQTTWCSSGELARYILHGSPYQWKKIPQIAETLHALYY